MHESRLFNIVYCLLDKGQATAAELAESLGVSVRTIYRDIDALSAAGIPVYAETGRNGGIRLLNHFVLDKAMLSDNEKQEILTALQSINAVRPTVNHQILQKLSALFHQDSENWLEVDFSRWGNTDADNEKFELLKSAILCRRKIKMHYANTYGEISERIVHPIKLMYKSKAWYLHAFCTQKNDLRTFKLNRILDAELLDESFQKPNISQAKENLNQEYTQIKLRFPKEMAYRVYDEFDKSQIEEQTNGDFIVSSEMPADAWLTGFLLSFAAQVDILSPDYLKESVAQQAKLIYEKNKH